MLRVKKLSENAIIPTRGSEFAAGFDLSSAVDTIIPARGKGIVKTDLAIAIPELTYARIAPRSGLAWKNFIDTGAGVVDYDYRGNVGVILFNHGDTDFAVNRGDRVAQLILVLLSSNITMRDINRIYPCLLTYLLWLFQERISMAPVEEVDELPETDRGAGGFGSTGVATTVALDDSKKRPLEK